MTQLQVKALEEEARTRIQSDETRAARFRQAVERVSDEVQNLAGRLDAEENGTLQRVVKLEVSQVDIESENDLVSRSNHAVEYRI